MSFTCAPSVAARYAKHTLLASLAVTFPRSRLFCKRFPLDVRHCDDSHPSGLSFAGSRTLGANQRVGSRLRRARGGLHIVAFAPAYLGVRDCLPERSRTACTVGQSAVARLFKLVRLSGPVRWAREAPGASSRALILNKTRAALEEISGSRGKSLYFIT
jgi:hypothetical protein